MSQLFGHEKLKVYQKGLGFAAIRSTLLDKFRHIALPAILPLILINRSDRLMRVLCEYFPPSHRGSIRQFLGAFIAAYNGWEWATVVCQDPTNDEVGVGNGFGPNLACIHLFCVYGVRPLVGKTPT